MTQHEEIERLDLMLNDAIAERNRLRDQINDLAEEHGQDAAIAEFLLTEARGVAREMAENFNIDIAFGEHVEGEEYCAFCCEEGKPAVHLPSCPVLKVRGWAE